MRSLSLFLNFPKTFGISHVDSHGSETIPMRSVRSIIQTETATEKASKSLS